MPVAAQEPNAEDVAEGMRIYRQKADCQACHGWAGDGRKMDTQMPDGANLRTTRLDASRRHRRDQVRQARQRHAGLRSARLQRRALQRHEAGGSEEAGHSICPIPRRRCSRARSRCWPTSCSTKVIGKGPMDRAKCIEFWGSDVDACAEFPNSPFPLRLSSARTRTGSSSSRSLSHFTGCRWRPLVCTARYCFGPIA